MANTTTTQTNTCLYDTDVLACRHMACASWNASHPHAEPLLPHHIDDVDGSASMSRSTETAGRP